MISTLTTSTVALAMNESVAGFLVLTGVFMVLGLLVQKELASSAGIRFRRLSKIFDIAILPLLVAFVMIIVSKAIEVVK